jgi:hypothetical protein
VRVACWLPALTANVGIPLPDCLHRGRSAFEVFPFQSAAVMDRVKLVPNVTVENWKAKAPSVENVIVPVTVLPATS